MAPAPEPGWAGAGAGVAGLGAGRAGASARIRRLWRWAVLAGLAGVVGLSCYRVVLEVRRLAFRPFIENGAAIDLLTRYIEVTNWFAGRPVYGTIESADYPPATYLMLRPLIGYESLTLARAVWSLTMVAALVVLTVLLYRHSRAPGRLERTLIALAPLASYATAATIRFGQTGLHLLVLVLAGATLLATRERSWARDASSAGLFTLAMLKPTFSAPFFWLALAKGGWRTAGLTMGFYVGLTLLAAAWQPEGVVTLIGGWLGQRSHIDLDSAHGNLHAWLTSIGLHEWVLVGSLVMLGVFGLWTWYHRDRDHWLLLGVLALVARMWSHHRWYDDVLLFLPFLALCREAAAAHAAGRSVLTPVLLASLLAVSSFAPGFVFGVPIQGSAIFNFIKVGVWLSVLGYLMWIARRPAATPVVPATAAA